MYRECGKTGEQKGHFVMDFCAHTQVQAQAQAQDTTSNMQYARFPHPQFPSVAMVYVRMLDPSSLVVRSSRLRII